jgi:hypothetical protein
MKTPALALLGVAAIAMLVALARREDGAVTPVAPASTREPVALAPIVATPQVVRSTSAAAAARSSPPAELIDLRASEAELRAEAADQSYRQVGGFLVDHLAARGLARSDAERVVRRLVDDSVGCLFDALRAEAAAQAVDYDPVLDALQANLHATDGPLLAGLLDMAPVVQRVGSCNLIVAEQAGLEPSALAEATRAAIGRAR